MSAETQFPPVTIRDRAALAAAVRRMNALMSRITAKQSDARAKVEAIETKLQTAILPAWEEYRALEQGVTDYALAHRETLLAGQSRQALTLPGGTLTYRVGLPSVQLDASPDVLIPRLRSLGLSRFVRVTEAVDKAAILREQAAIEGVEGIRVRRPEMTVSFTANAAAA